jgi:hypothetical protein
MTLAIRFVPRAGSTALYANGRVYAVAGAATVDVPLPDGAVIQPDQAAMLMYVGATADRPVNVPGEANWPPRVVYDTTLGKPVFLVAGSNPASWTDITGTAA